MQTTIVCLRSECIKHAKEWGGRVVTAKGDTARCERCGGSTADGGKTWTWTCAECETQVQPGELHGLFVPHLCRACLDRIVKAERASGQLCRMCRQPYSLCCC
jgi:hypothetical protein